MKKISLVVLCAAMLACTSVMWGNELSQEDQALLRNIVVANQRLEAALPLSSFFCEYVRTYETVSEVPQRGRMHLMHKVRGRFAFERGDDGTIDKLAVEETFLDTKTEPAVAGARPFQPGDITKTMRLGNTHYRLTTTGGTQDARRESGRKDTFKARRYSPWNMLFDFKAEPLTQLDTPQEIKCMVSINQFYVGSGRVTTLRRWEQDGQPLVQLDVEYSGQDKETGAQIRTLYTFRLAESMDYLPVEVRRTHVFNVEGKELRTTAVTKVENALSLSTSEGVLWIPARIKNESESPYGSSDETYELERDTIRYNVPIASAMFEYDPSETSHFYDADATLEKERRREAARKAYDTKYGSGNRVHAPDFASAEWLGEERSLEALEGSVILVVFWGKRCGRCIKALPRYESLRKELGPKGFELVALHCQEPDSEHILSLMKENACTFPVAQASKELTIAYAVEGLPSYYLLDKEGKIVAGRLQKLPSEERIVQLLTE